MNNSTDTGHPVLGVILGILGILIAIFLILLFGIIPGCIAGLLGLIAIILGIKARKSGRGIGAIVTGALALILAVAIAAGTAGIIKNLHNKALESGNAPLVAEFADNPYMGIMGMFSRAAEKNAENESYTDELLKEFKELIGMEETDTGAVSETPGE